MNFIVNIKEACVNSYSQAKQAFDQGADRVELCDNLHQGGTTPSYGTIKSTLNYANKLNKECCIMIRPRGSTFIYDDEEINIMRDDIHICKQLGVKQVVTGILTKENKINYDQMKQIIEFAKPIDVIFHMAIDDCENYEESIQQLISLGIKRVLTKGGKFNNAIEGQQSLKQMNEKYGSQITILCGGGVHNENYKELIEYTGCKEIHGTRLFNLS